MKFIFFSFRHRHRDKDLNNFLKTRIFKNFFLLNLSGPIKYFIAKILRFLKIGKAISLDGSPFILNIDEGINFWVRGTYLDIPEEFRNTKNNYISIINPILKMQSKIFQLYPINIGRSKINDNAKIIYVSKTLHKNHLHKERELLFDGQPHLYKQDFDKWCKIKKEILDNFSLLDDINYWNKNFIYNSEYKRIQIYINFKTFLRHEIIINIKSKFKEKILLVGDDWKDYFEDARTSVYSSKIIKKLYKGNICLDLGSILGSVSLYSRSNKIIESGGLLVQSKQSDSSKIWGNLSKDLLFNNLSSLYKLLDNLLINKKISNELLDKSYFHFKEGKNNMNKVLIDIFKS